MAPRRPAPTRPGAVVNAAAAGLGGEHRVLSAAAPPPRGAFRHVPRQTEADFLEGAVGILALQGSFALHKQALDRLGVSTRLVRVPQDLEGLAGLVIPGGESTVMSLLAREYGLFDPLVRVARAGLPMFGTCAGAILLGEGEGEPRRLGVAPIRLVRNAYGSQIDSFTAELRIRPFEEPFHGVFIRAPTIDLPRETLDGAPVTPSESSTVRVLAEHDGRAVLVEAGRLLLATFHPELTEDLRLHRHFLSLCRQPSRVDR